MSRSGGKWGVMPKLFLSKWAQDINNSASNALVLMSQVLANLLRQHIFLTQEYYLRRQTKAG